MAVHPWLGLRVTPAVFAAVFAVGAWANQFGVSDDLAGRASMLAGCAAMAVSAFRPTVWCRFAALGFGVWAALYRGLALWIIGQEGVERRSEIVGGSVWLTVAYLVLFAWIVTVPMVRHRG